MHHRSGKKYQRDIEENNIIEKVAGILLEKGDNQLILTKDHPNEPQDLNWTLTSDESGKQYSTKISGIDWLIEEFDLANHDDYQSFINSQPAYNLSKDQFNKIQALLPKVRSSEMKRDQMSQVQVQVQANNYIPAKFTHRFKEPLPFGDGNLPIKIDDNEEKLMEEISIILDGTSKLKKLNGQWSLVTNNNQKTVNGYRDLIDVLNLDLNISDYLFWLNVYPKNPCQLTKEQFKSILEAINIFEASIGNQFKANKPVFSNNHNLLGASAFKPNKIHNNLPLYSHDGLGASASKLNKIQYNKNQLPTKEKSIEKITKIIPLYPSQVKQLAFHDQQALMMAISLMKINIILSRQDLIDNHFILPATTDDLIITIDKNNPKDPLSLSQKKAVSQLDKAKFKKLVDICISPNKNKNKNELIKKRLISEKNKAELLKNITKNFNLSPSQTAIIQTFSRDELIGIDQLVEDGDYDSSDIDDFLKNIQNTRINNLPQDIPQCSNINHNATATHSLIINEEKTEVLIKKEEKVDNQQQPEGCDFIKKLDEGSLEELHRNPEEYYDENEYYYHTTLISNTYWEPIKNFIIFQGNKKKDPDKPPVFEADDSNYIGSNDIKILPKCGYPIVASYKAGDKIDDDNRSCHIVYKSYIEAKKLHDELFNKFRDILSKDFHIDDNKVNKLAIRLFSIVFGYIPLLENTVKLKNILKTIVCFPDYIKTLSENSDPKICLSFDRIEDFFYNEWVDKNRHECHIAEDEIQKHRQLIKKRELTAQKNNMIDSITIKIHYIYNIIKYNNAKLSKIAEQESLHYCFYRLHRQIGVYKEQYKNDKCQKIYKDFNTIYSEINNFSSNRDDNKAQASKNLIACASSFFTKGEKDNALGKLEKFCEQHSNPSEYS